MGNRIKINENAGMLDYFSVLVIGENPDEKILKYDLTEDIDKPYVIYEYSDINKLRRDRIKFYEEFLKNTNNSKTINSIKKQLDELKSVTDLQYYAHLGELYSFDENKNIISTENPMGKWISCEKGGKIFSNYLKDFNGNGLVSAKKSEIDWEQIHMSQEKVNLYNRTWDLCVDKAEPETEKDRSIIKNMKAYGPYFKDFATKDDYIKMSCAFWTYAVIDKHGMWSDMEYRDEFDWTVNFYERFVKELSPNTLITIYECTK